MSPPHSSRAKATRQDQDTVPEDFLDESEADEQDVVDDQEKEDDDRETIAAVSGWGISIAMHAILLLLLAFVVIAGRLIDDPAPIRSAVIEPPPPPPEKEEKERELTEVEVTIEAEVEVETPVVTQLEVEVEEISTEDEEISEVAEAKGREEAVSASETGGSGAFMAIGAGGGAAGAFGNRSGGGKKRALGAYGGSRASESSVDAALRWFMRHQSPNGMWDVDSYPANCDLEGPKCEPATNWPGSAGHHEVDTGATGYAVLCFLGAGYDHRTPNKYRRTVKAGIDWLISIQEEDGEFGDRNYSHPIATMALAEAYAMSNDPSLREPTQRGVDLILARQLKTGEGSEGSRLAWDYREPNPTRQDASISGWNVMALKSAVAGGFQGAGEGLNGARTWLERAWKDYNPEWKSIDPYSSTSRLNYTWNPKTGGSGTGFHVDRDLTCVGLLCAVFLGHGAGDPMTESFANQVMENQFPDKYPTNLYWLYYNTLGIFQMGGDRWQRWNNQTRDLLIDAQRKSEDCFDGSWDFKGTKWTGYQVGRIFSTAYATLSLQVYYRYAPLKK